MVRFVEIAREGGVKLLCDRETLKEYPLTIETVINIANSVECNEKGDYQFCTKEFKDTAIRLVDFLNMLLRDKNQLEKENEQLKQKLRLYKEFYPTGKWITELTTEELEKELSG